MNDKRRALVVLPTGIRGGAEGVAFTLIKALSADGWHVDLLIMSRGIQSGTTALSHLPRVRVFTQEYRSEKTSLLQTLTRIIRLAYVNRYELVYSTHLHVNAMLGTLRRFGLLPCRRLVARESTFIMARFHGLKRTLFWLMYQIGYGAQDLIIAQTDAMACALRSVVPKASHERLGVVPNPVRIELLATPVVARNDICRHRIVACGRLVPIKGFDILIKAFARIADEWPEWQLQIIGDGVEYEPLLEQIKKLRLGDRVRLLGYRERPWEEMAGADLGVVSSAREGFPNVMLEMMAARVKNIVTTPCTDCLPIAAGIRVAHSCFADDLALCMSEALSSHSNSSAEFVKYVERYHSPSRFMEAVVGVPLTVARPDCG